MPEGRAKGEPPLKHVPPEALAWPPRILSLPTSVRAVESGDLTTRYLKRYLAEARLHVPYPGVLVPKWMDLDVARGRAWPADAPTQDRRFLELLQRPYGW